VFTETNKVKKERSIAINFLLFFSFEEEKLIIYAPTCVMIPRLTETDT